MGYLEFMDRGRAVWSERLRPSTTVVGRSESADICLPNPEISRTHCVIVHLNESWFVTDRSRHGIRLNGEPLKRGRRTRLHPGDLLDLDCFVLRFVLRGPVPRAATADRVPRTAPVEPSFHLYMRLVAGPQAGHTIPLTGRKEHALGRDGHVPLAGLVRDAAVLEVIVGRVLFIPGHEQATLQIGRHAVPLTRPTPLNPGDEVRIGRHAFRVYSHLEERYEQPAQYGPLVGQSQAMRKTIALLKTLERSADHVLLVGQDGTGRRLAACTMHGQGDRATRPLRVLDGGDLVEADLDRTQLRGGTLLVCDLERLAATSQDALLQLLRAQAADPKGVDVRVVATCSAELRRLVDDGQFRPELHRLLATLTLPMPPLARRAEDIPLLARAILEREFKGLTLTDDAIDVLCRHTWPGNVQELVDVLRRSVLTAGLQMGDALTSLHLRIDPDTSVQDERDIILRTLAEVGGNQSQAARLLGLKRTTLRSKMQRLGIRTP